MKQPLQIAIDGPVGSGKGTLAIALAKRLSLAHIYTGGMWRALTLACLEKNTDINDSQAVLEVLNNSVIEVKVDENSGETLIILNGKDVTHDIFMPYVSNNTPIVAKYKEVRSEMVKRQKEIVQGKDVVVEGRDTTTVVLPNADIKIFLTADVNERARRRFDQLKEKNVEISFEEVLKDVVERDRADTQREESPLNETKDSFVVDTTNDTIEETIEKVMIELKSRNLI